MRLRNRVDPSSRWHAVNTRGAFMGNRGRLHDDSGEVIRTFASRAWITYSPTTSRDPPSRRVSWPDGSERPWPHAQPGRKHRQPSPAPLRQRRRPRTSAALSKHEQNGSRKAAHGAARQRGTWRLPGTATRPARWPRPTTRSINPQDSRFDRGSQRAQVTQVNTTFRSAIQLLTKS